MLAWWWRLRNLQAGRVLSRQASRELCYASLLICLLCCCQGRHRESSVMHRCSSICSVALLPSVRHRASFAMHDCRSICSVALQLSGRHRVSFALHCWSVCAGALLLSGQALTELHNASSLVMIQDTYLACGCDTYLHICTENKSKGCVRKTLKWRTGFICCVALQHHPRAGSSE